MLLLCSLALTQGTFRSGLHSTAGAHTFPVCCIASRVQEGPIRRVTSPPSPPDPKEALQRHHWHHRESQQTSPSFPCLQWSGGCLGQGKSSKEIASGILRGQITQTTRLSITHIYSILPTGQTCTHHSSQRLFSPRVWSSSHCAAHTGGFTKAPVGIINSALASTEPTDCPWLAPALVCKGTGDLGGV